MKRVVSSLLFCAVVVGSGAVRADDACMAKRAEVLESISPWSESFDELTTFTVAERRIVFETVAPAVRSAWWRQHLLGYLESNDSLDTNQVRVIEHAIALAGPELFATPEDDVLWPAVVGLPIQGLEVSARKVFSSAEIEKIFSSLGGEPSPTTRSVPKGFGNCECNVSDDWCSGSSYCYSATCNPNFNYTLGCGWFWLKPCNGLCS